MTAGHRDGVAGIPGTMGFQILVSAALEEGVNRVLALDPVAGISITELEGRVIAFELEGLGSRLYLIPGPDRVRILSRFEGKPDCVLRGSPLALMRMNNQRERTSQLFSGQVSISGDTDLAHRVGKILSSLDIDWEELLSRITGDILAHKAGYLLRQAGSWGSERAETLAMNVQEYLQEELRLLPARLEIEEFLSDVDRLRDDVERLQARILRLGDHLEGNT